MGKTTGATPELGMLPKNDERPPFFAFAVSLYQSDLLFRGLIDLAISGFAILVFTGALASALHPVRSAITALVGTLSRPAGEIRVGDPAQSTTQTTGPGSETVLAVKTPQISEKMIEGSPPAIAVVLKEARKQLQADEPELALDALAAADANDPAILFGKAVATLYLPGTGRALMVQQLLRGATQKAFAPAFTLNGLVLFGLLARHERGELPAADRVSLDGSGRAVEVTAAQLASEAVLWWQRGAAFHDPEAMRLLGMAEARGFNGKRNLPAAIAYWRDAAARGDAVARFELAHLYYQGIGVEPDSEKAYELFRQAADQGVLRAALALGTTLLAKGFTGDVEATREALRLLDVVAKKSPDPAERAFSHWVIGTFLSEAAPPALRDPPRAVDHYRFAARGAFHPALKSLARAYETGIGVSRDPVRAVGCLMLLKATNSSEAEPELSRLSQAFSAEELARAQRFRLADDPATPAFASEYDVRQTPRGLFKPVKSSFGAVP
ncbi:MAG: tetratricopeptide repeat protein [Xanthobacteraceae bacterium]